MKPVLNTFWKKFFFTFQMVFDAIDTNADGVISFNEWSYAFMSFVFVSGPESPFSLFFGPVVENP